MSSPILFPSNFVQLNCYQCKVTFFLPDDLHASARRDENISFYCPHGHKQHFPKGETEADKLRRERDRLKQQAARWQDEVAAERRYREAAERTAAAYKGQTTKLKKRAKAGICPCCTRHFTDLERHVATKHPDILKEDVA